MTKTVIVRGIEIDYEWEPDTEGLGGQVRAPGVADFHADSPADAREILFSVYSEGSQE